MQICIFPENLLLDEVSVRLVTDDEGTYTELTGTVVNGAWFYRERRGVQEVLTHPNATSVVSSRPVSEGRFFVVISGGGYDYNDILHRHNVPPGVTLDDLWEELSEAKEYQRRSLESLSYGDEIAF